MTATVYITSVHMADDGDGFAGFRFTVTYPERTMEGSISGFPPVSPRELSDIDREELRRLGEAILQAAQSPEAIRWRLPPKVQQ